VYAILVLVSIGPGGHGDFIAHLSITVTMALVIVRASEASVPEEADAPTCAAATRRC